MERDFIIGSVQVEINKYHMKGMFGNFYLEASILLLWLYLKNFIEDNGMYRVNFFQICNQ